MKWSVQLEGCLAHLIPMEHINRLGAVPKSTVGKYCLIVDLSYPKGQSVNNGISEAHCSLPVDQAAQSFLKPLAKVDILNTHRNVSVHPDDRWFLGMSWRGGTVIDTVLSFGL